MFREASPIGVRYTDALLRFHSCWSEQCLARIRQCDGDLDCEILEYEVLPQFRGCISLRLMTDGASPRDSRRAGSSQRPVLLGKAQALGAVFEKNARLAQAFDVLCLDHFQ